MYAEQLYGDELKHCVDVRKPQMLKSAFAVIGTPLPAPPFIFPYFFFKENPYSSFYIERASSIARTLQKGGTRRSERWSRGQDGERSDVN